MPDITCSQCAEPWDVYGLIHESIEYLATYDGDQLTTLEPVEILVRFLIACGTVDPDLDLDWVVTLADGTAHEPTVRSLFEWWYSEEPDDDVVANAVMQVVCIGIYRGVLHGKGCPACGFHHDGEGRYRDQTVREMVLDGVIDDDPTEFLSTST